MMVHDLETVDLRSERVEDMEESRVMICSALRSRKRIAARSLVEDADEEDEKVLCWFWYFLCDRTAIVCN